MSSYFRQINCSFLLVWYPFLLLKLDWASNQARNQACIFNIFYCALENHFFSFLNLFLVIKMFKFIFEHGVGDDGPLPSPPKMVQKRPKIRKGDQKFSKKTVFRPGYSPPPGFLGRIPSLKSAPCLLISVHFVPSHLMRVYFCFLEYWIVLKKVFACISKMKFFIFWECAFTYI